MYIQHFLCFSNCYVLYILLSFRFPVRKTKKKRLYLLVLKIFFLSEKQGEQLQAPIILRESSDDDVPLGARKVFTCNAIGYPPPTYMWLVNGNI